MSGLHEKKSSLRCVSDHAWLYRRETYWLNGYKRHKDNKSLFPGYLFFISEYPDELEKLLKKIPGFAQLLGDDDGPMKDYQGKIVHIDRHKRKAVLEVEFFGRRTEVTVGLGITVMKKTISIVRARKNRLRLVSID